MSNLKNKLEKITSKTPSNWKEKSIFRKNNPWLREYSSKIARRILSVIDDNKELNQVKLADTLDVSPQQISKIVKGQENMTLETIYKLSKALNFELISFPDYKYSHNYSPAINSSITFKELRNSPIDYALFGSGIYLQSITSVELENKGVNSDVFMQVNFLNIQVNQQTNLNG